MKGNSAKIYKLFALSLNQNQRNVDMENVG